MNIEENIYKKICLINSKCKKYFWNNKNLNFDKFGINKIVDEIIKESNELNELRKVQKKEEE